jgi:hypothetical protein
MVEPRGSTAILTVADVWIVSDKFKSIAERVFRIDFSAGGMAVWSASWNSHRLTWSLCLSRRLGPRRRIHGSLNMQGEGDTWTVDNSYELSEDGQKLTIKTEDYEFEKIRCP